MYRSLSHTSDTNAVHLGEVDSRIDDAVKHVVIINDNARITGGADKIALTSAIELARRGRNVTLLTAVGPLAPELVNVPNLTVVSTDQHEILHDPNRLRAATQGLWNRKSARIATDLFRSLSPSETVVHLHLWAKSLSSSVIRAACDGGFKIVCTLHDYLLACPNGTLFDHSCQAICNREPMSLNCVQARCDSRGYGDKLWRVARGGIQASAGRLPSGLTDVIAISDLVLSVMRPHLDASTRVHTLSNFVEVTKEPPAEVAKSTQFTFVGRLVKEKGPVLFAQAAQRAGVDALFLGEGECREGILAAYPEAEISGWLRPEQIFEGLRSSRAMVFPSLWYEAQPLVVLEALAAGLPCIVANTSAAREMIRDGETGLLFDGGDVEDLQRKLEALKDPGLAQYLGSNAYEQYWSKPKTVSSHLDGLEAIYRSMLRPPAQERFPC